jgi:hypothetical protein
MNTARMNTARINTAMAAPTLVPQRAVKQYSDVKEQPTKNTSARPGVGLVNPPYPAANELSGIYRTKSARGVDTREVKSRFDNSRPLVPALRLSLEFGIIQTSLKSLPSEARQCSNRKPSTGPEVQFHRNSTFPGQEITAGKRPAKIRSRLESSTGAGRISAGRAGR